MKEKILHYIYVITTFLLVISFIFGSYRTIYIYATHGKHLLSWFTFSVTLLGLFLVCFQIREQQNEHQANLKLYATWKKPAYYANGGLEISNLFLHVIPVNTGLVPGTYRPLGICKKEDWIKFLKPELTKIRKNKSSNYGIFSEKMFFDSKDVISDKMKTCLEDKDNITDLSGTELIFPTDKDKFKIISPKGVGNIKDYEFYNIDDEKDSIQKKLKLESYIPVSLVVVYLDPRFIPYTTEIKITPSGSVF